MIKETEEDTNRKMCHVNTAEELMLLNVHNIQNLYRFNAIPIQNSSGVFHRNRKKDLNLYGTTKTLIVKALLRKNNTGNITLPGFKLYYKYIVIKTVWY